MRVLFSFVLVLFSVGQVLAAHGAPVRYHLEDEVFEGYLIQPGVEAPLVILVHDWDGLTDYERQRAHMLAELGYAVFAVDLFGVGIRPVAIEERQRLTRALYSDRQRMRSLLLGGLAVAEAQGADVTNAVAMGYCFGGAAVLELARSGVDLKGFVSFHGGLATPEGQDYKQTKGSLLILHGTADASIPMNEFAGLAEELEAQGVPHEMITYGGAPHAFTVFDSDRYREDADRLSWQRFIVYLEDTVH